MCFGVIACLPCFLACPACVFACLACAHQHVLHVLISMSCMCSSACLACARRHALHVFLNSLFCFCMRWVSGSVGLSLCIPLSLSACLCVLAYLCFIVRLSVCQSVILSVCLPLCLYLSVFLQRHLHGVHLCLSFLLTFLSSAFLSCSHFSC